MEKWIYGGDALSRVDGRVVLTPFVLPGETASVTPEQERPDMLRTTLREVLQPSSRRIEPPCPYFMRCGGCHYQHAGYDLQVEQKTAILREQIRRVGKLDYTGEIEAISAEPLGYRNRTQFHIKGREIGYFYPGTRNLMPADQCPISSPKINQALGAIRAMAADRRWPDFLRSVELFTNEDQILLNVETDRPLSRKFFDWCIEQIPGTGSSMLDYQTRSGTFRVSHNSFFQVNRFLVDALVDATLAGAEGDRAFDLYAGVGLFSIGLARRFKRVIAVESGRTAVRDLESNAERANVAVEAVAQPVESYLPIVATAPDFVLADPPRAGLGKQVTRELVRLKPRNITIVACDPSTLARDLGALAAGGYRLEGLTMIDLFPQTYHIEAIARLKYDPAP